MANELLSEASCRKVSVSLTIILINPVQRDIVASNNSQLITAAVYEEEEVNFVP